MRDVDARVRRRNDEYLGVFNAHDDATLVATFFTDECVLLPPGADLVRGHDAVRAFWRREFELGAMLKPLATIEVVECGKSILELGSYELSWHDGRSDAGYYAVLWACDDSGVLKLATDIWNSR